MIIGLGHPTEATFWEHGAVITLCLRAYPEIANMSEYSDQVIYHKRAVDAWRALSERAMSTDHRWCGNRTTPHPDECPTWRHDYVKDLCVLAHEYMSQDGFNCGECTTLHSTQTTQSEQTFVDRSYNARSSEKTLPGDR